MEGHSTENNLPNQGVHLPAEPNTYMDLGDAISLNLVLNTLAGPSDSLPPCITVAVFRYVVALPLSVMPSSWLSVT